MNIAERIIVDAKRKLERGAKRNQTSQTRAEVIADLETHIQVYKSDPGSFSVWTELKCYQAHRCIDHGLGALVVDEFKPLVSRGGLMEHIGKAHIVLAQALRSDKHISEAIKHLKVVTSKGMPCERDSAAHILYGVLTRASRLGEQSVAQSAPPHIRPDARGRATNLLMSAPRPSVR